MPVRSKKLGLAFVGLITALVAATPAGAHLQEETDGNDPGALDIRKTSFNHRDGKIIHSVTTDGAWTAATLSAEDGEDNQANDNDIEFLYDTKGDDRGDFLVRIDTNNGNLVTDLFRKEGDGFVIVERLAAPTKDGKTVKVKFARGKIDAGGTVWWLSSTYYTAGSCDLCTDHAGRFKHEM